MHKYALICTNSMIMTMHGVPTNTICGTTKTGQPLAPPKALATEAEHNATVGRGWGWASLGWASLE